MGTYCLFAGGIALTTSDRVGCRVLALLLTSSWRAFLSVLFTRTGTWSVAVAAQLTLQEQHLTVSTAMQGTNTL